LLALIAILAAAGEAGISRDRLIALLWPEGDLEKTRHALTQSMYHARRTLREDTLFLSSGDQVRLNADAMGSDIRDLERALADNDLEHAAAVYTGPFLDDFFVPGAGDLERWRSGVAQRLVNRMLTTFDSLARDAAAANDRERAVHWRKRQLELDQLNTASARQLVEAMQAAGDRAGAIRQAQLHEALLQSELNLDPDPTFRALLERLRVPDATADATSPPSDAALGATDAPTVTAESRMSASDSSAAPFVHRRWTPRAILGAAVAAVVLIVALTLLRARTHADARGLSDQQKLVVAPFRVSGADASIAFLREGLVELLSARLNDDTIARPVDPGAVLQAWRSKDFLGAADAPSGEIARVARRLGADAMVSGSVVGDAGSMVVSATLVALPNGAVRASATVSGSLDSLPTLVDRLAARLLVASAGEGDRFANRMTPSLPALRAYLSGQAAYHRGDYGSAARAYEDALQLDSTFALAAFRLALAADHRNGADQHDRALALAWANRDDLTERDLLHLIAFAGPRYPAPSTEAEQLAAWEDAVAASPDRAEIWSELGERLFYDGGLLAIPDADRRAANALRKALELDAAEPSARRLLILLAARHADTAALRTYASPAAMRDSTGSLNAFVAWRVAHATGDTRALARMRASFADLDDANLRAIAMASQYDDIGGDDGERALRIRAQRVTQPADHMDVILAQHSLALNRGDFARARDLTEQLEEKLPATRAHLRLRVLDALYGGGDSSAAMNAASALVRSADAPAVAGSSARPLQLADICVVAQWRIARGDIAGIRGAIAQLRQPTSPRTSIPIAANPQSCADLLEAALAVRTHASDATSRVVHLDSLLLAGPAVSDAGAYAPILIARLYEQVGSPERALDAIRRRPYLSGWPRYQATAHALETRLTARLTHRDG
jgi:DNA-binding SARP family transcriptional activator